MIREATPHDYNQIQDVIRTSLDATNKYLNDEVINSIKNYYSSEMLHSMQKIFVYTNGSEILGCVGIEKENICKMLYVVPTFKGALFAKELTEHMKAQLKNQGYNTLEANVLESAKKFMMHMGGQEKEKSFEKLNEAKFVVYHMVFEL